jgi:hypothetical protein
VQGVQRYTQPHTPSSHDLETRSSQRVTLLRRD